MKKKALMLLLCTTLTLPLAGCGGVKQADYDSLKSEKESAESSLTALQEQYDSLDQNFTELLETYNNLREDYKDYQKKMKPFEEMEEAEAKQRKADAEAKEKAEKAAAEAEEKESKNQELATTAVQKIWDFQNGTLATGATRDLYNDALEKVNALTNEAKKNELMQAVQAADATFAAQEQAAAEEEARGYDTGITYDQLARTPDDFIAKKVKFYGKVIQVMEGDGTVQIRLAVNDNYDTIILGEYLSSIVSSRILEDDHITIYGSSLGTISYQSTLGSTITIPGVYIDKIDQ